MIPIKQKPYTYAPLPIERRYGIVPKHSISSLIPADVIADHFITGNGHLRVQSNGHPYNTVLGFTNELLFEPLWDKTPTPPDMRPYLPKIRELLLAGKPDEIDPLIDEAQIKAGYDKYMNFGNKILYPIGSPHMHKAFWLTVDAPEVSDTQDYLRWLDMDNGMISSIWTNANGFYRNDSFCAYDGDLIINRFEAPAGQLTLDLKLRVPGTDGTAPFEMFPHKFPKSDHAVDVTSERITLSFAYNPEWGQKGYTACVRILPQGGSVTVTDNVVHIENADSLVLASRIIRYESNFTLDRVSEVEQEVMELTADVDALLKKNEQIISDKMNRSRIRLGTPEDYVLTGEELLKRTHQGQELDPMMLEKLYDMGRFFQIYESGYYPPMFGQHNINTNLQVCAGNNTGLFDEMDVYFRYYESKFDDFRTNANLLFGARGLLASVHCDPDSGLYYHFSRTYPHYAWTGCLGWVYNELWGYYLVTGDLNFLRDRVIPAYKEMALFFEDYACDRGPDGKVLFYPSFSPEDPTPNPGYETVTCANINPTRINSVMDIAICREILTNLIDGCQTLGTDLDMIPHWQEQLDSLPTYLLDEEGGLKEWAWDDIEENFNHRHVSHHYDVWPGRAITLESDPELVQSIIISNRKRGQQDDSAHGIIHRAFTAIRLKDMEELEQNLSQLLAHGFVRRTLQTNHFPYRMHFPDLQGAVPAFLIEMSVQSRPGVVELLPMIPDHLMTGRLDGVWLYTWAKLESLEWTPTGAEAILTSNKAQTLKLSCGRPGACVNVNGEVITEYTFKAGETITIECEW